MTSKNHVIRVLLVGDPGIGKTSLARTLTEDGFPTADSLSDRNSPCPTYTCTAETIISVDDSNYNLHICDPSNEDALKEQLSQVDFCYACFDITSPQTFHNIKQKWWSIIISTKRKPKIILVGLKQDLTHDGGLLTTLESQGLQVVSHEAANNLANEMKTCLYVEVSALKSLGVQELKEKTVFEFLQPQSADSGLKKKRCVVM